MKYLRKILIFCLVVALCLSLFAAPANAVVAEGTATMALASYLVSTGMPLIVVDEGAVAVESLIVDYCAANALDVGATTAALAGGCSITPAGVVILTAAAVVVCASIAAWLLTRNNTTYDDTPPDVLQPTSVSSHLKTASGQNVPFVSVQTIEDAQTLRLNDIPLLFMQRGAAVTWPSFYDGDITFTLNNHNYTLTDESFIAQPDLSGGSYIDTDYSYCTIFDFSKTDGAFNRTSSIYFSRFRSSSNWYASSYLAGSSLITNERSGIQSQAGNSGISFRLVGLVYVISLGLFYLCGFNGGNPTLVFPLDLGDFSNRAPLLVNPTAPSELTPNINNQNVKYMKKPASPSSSLRNPVEPLILPPAGDLEITLPPRLNPTDNPNITPEDILEQLKNPEEAPNRFIDPPVIDPPITRPNFDPPPQDGGDTPSPSDPSGGVIVPDNFFLSVWHYVVDMLEDAAPFLTSAVETWNNVVPSSVRNVFYASVVLSFVFSLFRRLIE